jgi:hypothetical protein
MYQDLVDRPMEQLEKIYSRYGGIPESLRQNFITAESENPQGKYGTHEYKLSDFELNREDLIQRNPSYYSLYEKQEAAYQNRKIHG